MGAQENTSTNCMNSYEITKVRQEAAKQTLLEILSQEFKLEDFFSDLPDPKTVLNIIKNKNELDINKEVITYADLYSLNKENIEIILKEVLGSIDINQGEKISESVKETLKHLKHLNLLKRMYDADKDFSAMDPVHSKAFAESLLELEEHYVSGKNWKQAESILLVAEDFVKNVTGLIRPRLYATMDLDWGIYLWKCGDYSESEKKLQKANAGVQELIRKNTNGLKETEIEQNNYLYARILHGFGTLYGDFSADKFKAIEFNKQCLKQLDKLKKTYKVQKMETSVLNNIGVAYHKMAENFPEKSTEYFLESVKCYEEALDISKNINHQNMTGWLLFNAGEVYAFLGDFEKAKNCSKESRQIFTDGFPSERGLSGVEMLEAIICKQQDDYKTALEHINQSIILREKLNEPRRIADALDCRGDIYIELDEKANAIEDYQTANAIYTSIGSQDKIKRTTEKLELLCSFNL